MFQSVKRKDSIERNVQIKKVMTQIWFQSINIWLRVEQENETITMLSILSPSCTNSKKADKAAGLG